MVISDFLLALNFCSFFVFILNQICLYFLLVLNFNTLGVSTSHGALVTDLGAPCSCSNSLYNLC
jgi:hypothetical protein